MCAQKSTVDQLNLVHRSIKSNEKRKLKTKLYMLKKMVTVRVCGVSH